MTGNPIKIPLARGNAKVEPLSESIVSSGVSLRLWRLYAQAWLVCLVFPILYLVQTPLAPVDRLVILAGLAVFVVAYTRILWHHPLKRGACFSHDARVSFVLCSGLTALVLCLSWVYGSSFLWLFIGVGAVVGVVLPARPAFLTVLLLTLVTFGLGVWLSGGFALTDWLELLPLVLLVRGLGLDMIGLARLSEMLRELQATRQELARRAVTEERQRLARDLHDLLGHTLSLITLKTELAGRLVEHEPTRAAREIHEVEQIARDALRDVRSAVAGYRQPTLAGELHGARQILEAAGIACEIEQPDAILPDQVDATLAWVVREGVTNVIRHSRAHHCIIRVRREAFCASVEMINDGVQARKPGAEGESAGSGISGLAERVNIHGGKVNVGPRLVHGQMGFRLGVELPIPDKGDASAEEQS